MTFGVFQMDRGRTNARGELAALLDRLKRSMVRSWKTSSAVMVWMCSAIPLAHRAIRCTVGGFLLALNGDVLISSQKKERLRTLRMGAPILARRP